MTARLDSRIKSSSQVELANAKNEKGPVSKKTRHGKTLLKHVMYRHGSDYQHITIDDGHQVVHSNY
jgi:hypothetical protein